jgi:hypothetical protein
VNIVNGLTNSHKWQAGLEWFLPQGLKLTGNDQGINGHVTTRSQCSNYDSATGNFGWNYESGTTNKDCGKPPKKSNACPYVVPGNDPNCHYQFGFQGLAYGITPWGEPSSENTQTLKLPMKITTLSNLYVTADPSYSVTDTANPPVSQPPFQRARLIYDFFLTNANPVVGKVNSQSITDEIIIDIGYNKDFQFECGYYPGKSTKPIVPDVFKDGTFDLVDITDMDNPSGKPGMFARMTHFRRIDGECKDNGPCKVNANLDLMRFIDKARTYNASERKQKAGDILSVLELGNEIYDNIKAEVKLTKFELSALAVGSDVVFA